MVQAGRETHPVDDAPTEHEGKKGGGETTRKIRSMDAFLRT